MATESLGILLLSFGSARDDVDIPTFLERIRHGRPAPPELIDDLRARYRRVGGSPLVDITTAQAAALQERLDPAASGAVLVLPAMLYSDPEVETAVAELVGRGVTTIVGVPLAPQQSPHSAAYFTTLERAVSEMPGVSSRMAGPWHLQPDFIRTLADHLQSCLAQLDEAERETAQILFTAHSLPCRVPGVDRYAEQVEQTASTLADRVGVSRSGWEVVFQSRSGPSNDWLGPDILDVVSGLPARGTRAVIAAPVQFCADHLEVLFDLDVATRERAEALGLRYLRPASLNTAPGFIDALADVVRTTVEFAPEVPTWR
jgi:ferrochelatase